MADRTHNDLDVDIWDKDWGELAIVIAAKLIGSCPNKEGIFDFPGGRIRRFMRALKAGEDEISAGILKLVEVGLIRFYREGSVVWIVKKFKREAKWVQTVKQREGVRRMIAKFPEIEPEFQAMYGHIYLETGLKVIDSGLIAPIEATKIAPQIYLSSDILSSEDNSVTTTTKKESKTPVTASNKLRAPTERERQLFPLVEVLGKIINEGRTERRLAPVKQSEAKAAIVLRQCYDKHGLQPKQLIALAQWMFSADNRDLDFNTGNLSYLHNWRKPWTNGVAVICKYEEFLKWLQKQAV